MYESIFPDAEGPGSQNVDCLVAAVSPKICTVSTPTTHIVGSIQGQTWNEPNVSVGHSLPVACRRSSCEVRNSPKVTLFQRPTLIDGTCFSFSN